MSDYGKMTQNLLLRWAEPFQPFDTPGAQLKRAFDNMHGDELENGWSKFWNGFYAKCGKETYEIIRDHAEKVRRRKRIDARMRAQFVATLEAMRETDAEFFSRQIKAYSDVVRGDSGADITAD